MTKAVFISKINSVYDDLPEERYHFPRQYLKRIEATAGDWIIYYEPRRNNGRQVYYATAQVKDIQQDAQSPSHYYALMDNYLEFENPVPFKIGDQYLETSLLNPDGSINPGLAQSAIHPITDAEYQLILQTGFAHILEPPQQDAGAGQPFYGFAEPEQEIFERPIVQTILNRPFRDQAFAEAVKVAYDKTCAMTGLRLINGGGRAEVQAAHIRPVASHGPDSVRNGIALCGTVHWMFDRGLISLNDDYEILKSKNGIPEAMDRLIRPESELLLPERPDLRPHPTFLQYHRKTFSRDKQESTELSGSALSHVDVKNHTGCRRAVRVHRNRLPDRRNLHPMSRSNGIRRTALYALQCHSWPPHRVDKRTPCRWRPP